MTKLLLTREPVEATPRGYIGLTTRRLAWEASAGLCFWCGKAVPWIGQEVEFDHAVPLGLGGADALENIGPLHAVPCHKQKTAQDLRRIAKAKRQQRLLGERRSSRRPLASRGFIQGLTRGFNGIVKPKSKGSDRHVA